MFIALSLLIAVGVCEAQVVVDRATTIGEIKPMNGVNNGPLSPTIKGNVQGRNNTEVYAAAHITDSARCYTEIPLVVRNGEVEVTMEPNSVVVIDFE